MLIDNGGKESQWLWRAELLVSLGVGSLVAAEKSKPPRICSLQSKFLLVSMAPASYLRYIKSFLDRGINVETDHLCARAADQVLGFFPSSTAVREWNLLAAYACLWIYNTYECIHIHTPTLSCKVQGSGNVEGRQRSARQSWRCLPGK